MRVGNVKREHEPIIWFLFWIIIFYTVCFNIFISQTMVDRKSLINELGKQDACKPALIAMRSMSVFEMLKLYVKNIDYTIGSKLLSAEFLKSNASDRELKSVGIYIDYNGTILNPSTIVILGSSQVKVLSSGFDVCRVYATKGVSIELDAAGNSHVIIDSYGVNISINKHGNSHVKLIQHEPV